MAAASWQSVLDRRATLPVQNAGNLSFLYSGLITCYAKVGNIKVSQARLMEYLKTNPPDKNFATLLFEDLSEAGVLESFRGGIVNPTAKVQEVVRLMEEDRDIVEVPEENKPTLAFEKINGKTAPSDKPIEVLLTPLTIRQQRERAISLLKERKYDEAAALLLPLAEERNLCTVLDAIDLMRPLVSALQGKTSPSTFDEQLTLYKRLGFWKKTSWG